VAVIGSFFVLSYFRNIVVHSSATPATTTTYTEFQPIPDLGNGTWQFEENNLHVYNYTFNGTIATFNMTVGASVIVPPTLYDGLLLVDLSKNSTSGGVAAINIQTGQMVWKTILPNMMMTQPLTYENLVIVGLGNNNYQDTPPYYRGNGTNYVAALNFSTGKIVWTFPTIGEDMPTPLIYNGLVIGANGNAMVYALNPLTGQEVWNASLPSGSFVSMSSPALLGDSIYFGANNPYVFYSVNLTDDQVSWSTPIPANGGLDDCSPAIWNDTVISGYTVMTSSGMLEPVLFAMNTTNGNILWQLDETAGVEPPAIQVPPVTVWNGIVYSDPAEGGTLYAVNASSGTLLWNFHTGGDNSNANIFDGNLWMVNTTGTLFVLNATTGTLLKTTNIGVPVGPGNLIFAGQNVIISGTNGQVISIPVSDIYPSD
jgi:outer membrane protein assembly factor BamB